MEKKGYKLNKLLVKFFWIGWGVICGYVYESILRFVLRYVLRYILRYFLGCIIRNFYKYVYWFFIIDK